MRTTRLWIVVLPAILVLAALALAACGGTTTTTTAAPTTTTAAPTTTTAAPTTTTAAPTTTTAAIDPKALFVAYCQLSGCHSRVPQDSLARVKTLIENGKGSAMPGFKDKLSAAEIAALAAWVANGGK